MNTHTLAKKTETIEAREKQCNNKRKRGKSFPSCTISWKFYSESVPSGATFLFSLNKLEKVDKTLFNRFCHFFFLHFSPNQPNQRFNSLQPTLLHCKHNRCWHIKIIFTARRGEGFSSALLLSSEIWEISVRHGRARREQGNCSIFLDISSPSIDSIGKSAATVETTWIDWI